MKPPKNLYIHIQSGALLVNTNGQIKNDCVRYIRADLAELTWEDIQLIIQIYNEVVTEAGGTLKDFCEEVLRRFLESKNR